MSDYDAIQKRRNLVVGVWVIIALCALVWLIFIFGDLPTAVSQLRSFEVRIQFPQAPGVEENTPVRFAGYQVGRVVAIEPPRIIRDLRTGQSYHQTVVVAAIDKQFNNIPSNVDVKLVRRGLGSSYIELDAEPDRPLVPLDPNLPGSEYLFNHVVVQGQTSSASEFFPEGMQKKLDQLISSLNALVGNANSVLGDKQNQENIKLALANLSEATQQATVTMKELEKLSATGNKTVADTGAAIDRVSNSLIETSTELSRTVAQINKTLIKINEGQGTAGRLINDASLYENLLDSSRQLNLAFEQVKLLVAEAREKGIPIKLK